MSPRLVLSTMLLFTMMWAYPPAAFSADTPKCASEVEKTRPRRLLSVVVYPFIPNFKAVLYALKSDFEKNHPDIELCFIDLSGNYYATTKGGKPAKDYVGTTDADVYELDSVFLRDFYDDQKIQELPPGAQLPPDQLLNNAVLGVTLDGKRYGAPHWVCGNFLFFRASDVAMRDVHTLTDLERAIGGSDHAESTGLLTDLKGSSTLGEFYLEAATDQFGWPAASKHLGAVEGPLEKNLARLSRLCDEGYCRDSDYHGTEIYGRLFARNRGRVLVGYSETLHSVLSETSEGCAKNDRCLADSDIDVTQLSLDDKSAQQISWVDSFVISKKCQSGCLKDAVAFIQYMNQDATFASILQPSPDVPPAYLLPAKASLFDNLAVTGTAHLYGKLRKIIENASSPSAPNLNEMLRNDGSTIDATLPPK